VPCRVSRRLLVSEAWGSARRARRSVAAEKLFRHKVITLLRHEGLSNEERIALLLSWRHSGFSAHNAVTVPVGDTERIERLARYLLRAPVALERLEFGRGPGCALPGQEVEHESQRQDVRDHGSSRPPAPARARAHAAPDSVLRLLLEHRPRPQSRGGCTCRLRTRGARARGRRASTPAAVVGPSDPPHLRSRSPHLHRMRWSDADHRRPARSRVVRKILDFLARRPGRSRAPPIPAGALAATSR
jgi:hypothetical protein